MRFVDKDKKGCGSGSAQAVDYLDGRWRSKAEDYLNHGGRLFIAGEHYPLTDRNEGLYRLLIETAAVKEGYDPCPPSARGNSSTEGPAFYRVKNGLGPSLFYGAWVGGIPMALLNGTSFVDTSGDWEKNDQVDRSVVSGWTGDQLGGAIDAPVSCRGKLFVVWDATMWTLWQPEQKEKTERDTPIWDDASWFAWDNDPDKTEGEEISRAQRVTRKFFPAIARWLGKAEGPCGPSSWDQASIVKKAPPPTSRPLKGPAVGPRVLTPAIKNRTSTVPPAGKARLGTLVQLPSSQPSASAPTTIVFDHPPVYFHISFKDGPGDYRLDILDGKGNFLRTVFQESITEKKETWTGWDGKDENGKDRQAGRYFAALSKNGNPLRMISLFWVLPNQ